MIAVKDGRYRAEIAALRLTPQHDKFHWTRFWTRWKVGQALPVPKTMFLGVSGRKLGLLPTSPAVYRRWKTWLRPWVWSEALVWVVVCDNLGDPLPKLL